MPGTMISRGNILYSFIISASLTPAQVNATTAAEQTFTVPGLRVGDQISGISFSGAITNLVSIVNFRVSTADTLGISFANGTGGALTPAPGTYLIEVNRPEAPNNLPATAA